VLAIAVAEPDRRVQKFLETTPVDFPVLLDRDRAVAKAWQVVSLPTSFVLDADLNGNFVVETEYAWDAIDAGKLVSASAMAVGGSTTIKTISKHDSGG
jgi:peroxiredoxin